MLLALLCAALGHTDLVKLFDGWRAFQKPHLENGVPDYTPAAIELQHEELAAFRKRLAAFEIEKWPVADQVDFWVLKAEMNGLDFDHRVLQPWARNPDFYVTVFTDETDQPAREGPHAFGGVELFRFKLPEQLPELERRLEPIPALLEQARGNLTGNARDLWVYGIRDVKDQRGALARLPQAPAVKRALEATDAFIEWLEKQSPSRTGPSGVGIENYDWYLQNVQLVPYRWADEVLLMQRELARAKSSLLLEEAKNRGLPGQTPVSSREEHTRKFSQGVTDYMEFLARRDVLTIKPYMDPALRAHVGAYNEKLDFFTEVDYRDPALLRTHGYHWFDLARMENEPNPDPIRRGPLLYNIFNTRTEGFATAMEEISMHLGLCDPRPRSRELVWILLAQRAARALGDLRMHANQMTLEQAAQFASANTPRGWLRLSGATVWGEQHLYLEQPGYGTSYVVGKAQIDEILSRWPRSLKDFMDEKDAIGLIPVSLVRWQMTGEKPAFLR
jgi:hypothetical protein